MLAVFGAIPACAQGTGADGPPPALSPRANLPPAVAQAQRFLAQRGWTKARMGAGYARWRANLAGAQPQNQSTAPWQAAGPAAVSTPAYGLVTGRVSSLALDPADSTGNRLYVGTTGGGVWESQNAAASSVVFTPLTDTVGAMAAVRDASISIGALTVQPGGTGVILAGTGDPNDALDSYYGAGILRSADGGNTWSLIQNTANQELSFEGKASRDLPGARRIRNWWWPQSRRLTRARWLALLHRE